MEKASSEPGPATDSHKPENRIAMFGIHSDPLAPLGSQEAGGQNIYIYSLVKELDKKGWSIDVFTRHDQMHKKTVAFIGKKSRVIRLKGGPIKHLPKTELFDHFPELYQNFLNFIDQQNPYSIFHGHHWDGGWMALKAAEQFKKPFVENFHSLGKIRFQTKKQYLKNGNEAEFFEKRFSLEEEIVKKSNIIISLAESEKNDLKKFYQAQDDKIRVIAGGVNLSHFRPIDFQKARKEINVGEDAFVLLFVGRLEWRKGIGTLISAASLLRNEISNLKVIVVGGKIYGKQKNSKDFKEYQRLTEKAKEEKIEDIVNFTGRVDNGRLPFFYSAANIFVVPSYYEPFGLVALEGMACKAPIVASRIGGLTTIIQEGVNGLLFEPRNPLDLKENVLKIFKSKELVQKIIENGYKDVAENYSWYKIVGRISDIYDKLITSNNKKSDENNPNHSI
jgi:glycosyltransferase involved in cell wall biosynthesis